MKKLVMGVTLAIMMVVSIPVGAVDLGDLDDSSVVDLKDAILALQVVAGVADVAVNKDGTLDKTVGLNEVIIILNSIGNPLALSFTNTLGMTFNLIPAGTFTMGSPSTEPGRDSDETEHQVTLTKSYYIQTTEVTQGQWRDVMGSNPSYFSSCGDDCPVEQVSWDDIQEFITKMNQRGEGTYRLPTEAEWERAARGGDVEQTAFYNGGITNTSCDDPNLDQIGWYCGNADSTTHPTAQKQANAYGLYDMSGNVWEWCQDIHTSSLSGPVTDPLITSGGSGRVFRGGSWNYYARYCRSADRDFSTPSFRYYDLGLRLCLSPGQ